MKPGKPTLLRRFRISTLALIDALESHEGKTIGSNVTAELKNKIKVLLTHADKPITAPDRQTLTRNGETNTMRHRIYRGQGVIEYIGALVIASILVASALGSGLENVSQLYGGILSQTHAILIKALPGTDNPHADKLSRSVNTRRAD